MRVSNKSIIVTGAGNGIGEGIAKRLAAEGGKVIVNDINEAGGQRVVAEITAAGGTAAFFKADVTKSAEVKAMVDEAVRLYGRLDVVVNNAGWTHRNRPMLEVSEEEFDKVYAINMKSIYLSAIHAVPSACSRWPPVGSGALRSNTPMLSSPRKPPSKTFLPKRSLRFTHQVKLSISLLKVSLRNSRSVSPRSALSVRCRNSVAKACTGGLTSPKFHS